MKRVFGISLVLLFLGVRLGYAAIYIQSVPLKLIKSNETAIADNTDPFDKIALEWLGDGYGPPPADCEVRFRTSPGSQISDYDLGPIAQSQQGKLTDFIPDEHGMTGGVYYCVVVEVGNLSNYSQEFVLYVETLFAPVMLLPVKGSKIYTATPNFSWNKVLGVPYNLIIVTDQEIVYVPETGEVVTGDGSPITPIWQAITGEDNIVYGTPDPSGYLSDHCEPLLGGTTCTWIVFNCYANNPAYVSTVIMDFFEFTFIQSVNLPQATLTSPPDDDVTEISSETITLTWDDNWDSSYDPIVNFHIYAYMREEAASGLSGAILAWDASTSNTYYDVDAESMFTNAVYDWKVIAEDAQGRGRKSDTRSFNYHKPLGTLFTYVRYYNPATASTEPVPTANIDIEAISGGSTNPFPFITNNSGNLSVDLVPGTYRVTASKESFEVGIDTAQVMDGLISEITIVLEKSPCYITGTVEDDSEIPVFDAKVEAAQLEEPYSQKTVYTDNSGIFKVSVRIDTSWDISVSKLGYSTSSVVHVDVSSYPSTADIGTITIAKNENTIMGTVVNESGYPISVAEVKVELGAVEWTKLTDDSGSYIFKVNDGTWTLTAEKTGFVSPSPVGVPVFLGETVNRQLVLTSQANRVTGCVTDNQQNIENATVRALDPFGAEADSDFTDVFGQYNLNLAGGNTYDITASKQGYTSPPSQAITFGPTDSGLTVSGVDFILTPNDSHIKGKVTIDGVVPLGGAAVTDGISVVYTGIDGEYDLTTTEGTYDVDAAKEGYMSSGLQQVTVGVGETIDNIDFVLTPNASVIKGNVYSDGEPVFEAEVVISSYPAGTEITHTFTSETGAYTFSLDAGTWYLKAVKNRFIDSDEIEVSVSPGQVSTGNDLTLVLNIGYLAGRVVDEGLGFLRNVLVAVKKGGMIVDNTTTDTYGEYTFALEPDSYTLTAEKIGYKIFDGTTSYSVEKGSTTAAGDIVMIKTSYFISGYVTGPGAVFLKDVEVNTSGYMVLTDINGYYCFSVNEGSYEVWVKKNGYKPVTSTQTVTFTSGVDPDGTTKTADFLMDYDYAVITGSVTTGSVTPVVGATVTANGSVRITDGEGVYSFDAVGGEYDIGVRKTGYQDASTTTYVVGGETKILHFDLIPANYSVSGEVLDDGSSPISNATVRIELQGGGVTKSVLTTSAGAYTAGGLANGGYDITVTRTDYSFSSGASSFTINNADVVNLDYVLVLNDDTIYVTVKDTETTLGISGAGVVAIGEAPGTQGYGGSANTDSGGNCTISNLKSGKYTLKVSKPGYKLKISTDVDSGTSKEITLERNYGSISGRVTKDSSGFEDVLIKVESLSGSSLEKSTVTLSDGNYHAGGLLPDSYLVTAIKSSHYSIPLSVEVTITASSVTASDIEDVNFELVYSSITTLELALPGELVFSNTGDSYQILLIAKDADGRLVNYSLPEWSISPAAAGSVSETGLLDVADNFFGEAVVSALVEGRSVETVITIYYKVISTDIDVEITDSEGLKLMIPRNITRHPSMSEDKISILAYDVSSVRMMSGIYRVCSKVFNLKPDGFRFSDKVRLYIPETGGLNEDLLSIGRWDNEKLKWISIEGEASGGYVSTQIEHFSEYTALAEGEGLGIKGLVLNPNPFSPKVKPIEFSYYPTSNSGLRVWVSIKIYNMIGDFVRTIFEDEQKVGEPQSFSWDGLNSKDEMSLNGRYIVDFKVEDGTGERHYLKTIVLIK
jgi:hypothetical protein